MLASWLTRGTTVRVSHREFGAGSPDVPHDSAPPMEFGSGLGPCPGPTARAPTKSPNIEIPELEPNFAQHCCRLPNYLSPFLTTHNQSQKWRTTVERSSTFTSPASALRRAESSKPRTTVLASSRSPRLMRTAALFRARTSSTLFLVSSGRWVRATMRSTDWHNGMVSSRPSGVPSDKRKIGIWWRR